MQLNSTIRTVPMTPQEVNRKLREKGFTKASYSRMIKRSKGAVTRLCNGEIGGELRQRFAKFLGVPEEMLPRKENGK